jgi:hypothetical protein
MTPIAISNTRPGFVPFSVRPLVIVGQAQQRPTFRPAPYRPSMLSNPPLPPSPSMDGLLDMFSAKDIPLSLTLGLAGAGAMVLAGVVPTPVKEISTVVGLGLIGFGLLNLFSGEAVAGDVKAPQKTPSGQAFQMIKGNIISPTPDSKPNVNLLGSSYDATVIWYNGPSESINFTYDVYADVRVPGQPSAQVTPGKSIYVGKVSLKPGEDSGPITITLPILRPIKPFESFGVEPQFWNELTLRKWDAQANPVPVTSPVRVGPFYY